MKNYFDFIMYLAFRTLLIYENKRSLTLEQLHNYRIKLCEKTIEYHSQFTEYDDKKFEENLRFFQSSNVNMTLNEEEKNFIDFLRDNEEYFFYKDGVISLRDKVTYKELEDANFELDSFSDRDDMLICGDLIAYHDCIECLDILGAKKVKEFIYKIIEDEKKIEKAYQTYTDIELEQNIKKVSEDIDFKLAIIGNLKTDKMRCYHRAINNWKLIDPNSKGEDTWLLSDKLMELDKFYNLSPKSIDSIIENKYQRAIFDNGTLVYDRLDGIMDAIWSYREPDAEMELEPVDPEATSLLIEEQMERLESYEDEFEDDEEVESDIYDEDDDINQVEMYLYRKKVNMTFYLNYINNINKLLKIYRNDETLEKSKCRLLYLLDGYGDNLFREEYFTNVLKNVSMDEINYKEDFDDFYALSRLFLVDILEGFIDDEMTIRKMLFISTYYNLTKDRRIKRIINKYKKTEIGEKIFNIVLDNDYSNLTSKFIQSQKELIKKKNNKNKE